MHTSCLVFCCNLSWVKPYFTISLLDYIHETSVRLSGGCMGKIGAANKTPFSLLFFFFFLCRRLVSWKFISRSRITMFLKIRYVLAQHKQLVILLKCWTKLNNKYSRNIHVSFEKKHIFKCVWCHISKKGSLISNHSNDLNCKLKFIESDSLDPQRKLICCNCPYCTL